jgi:hypothetical protein
MNRRKSIRQYYLLYQKSIFTILKILLVGLFALIEWRLENRFFAIFIVLFYIVATIFQHLRYLDLITVITVIFYIINTSTLDSLTILKEITVPSVQHPKTVLTNLFTPDSGQEVLPIPVQNMLEMLHKHMLENYKLSPEFSINAEIMQRMVEAAWPIKLEMDSPFIFINTDETDQYQDCVIIDDSEDLTLVDCH